jgi:hypothetical protein
MDKLDLIDRNDAVAEMCGFCGCFFPGCDGTCKAREYIATKAPSVDAEPVQHGRWIPNSPNDVSQCSRCGFGMLPITAFQDGNCIGYVFPSNLKYCPQCGASLGKAHEGKRGQP